MHLIFDVKLPTEKMRGKKRKQKNEKKRRLSRLIIWTFDARSSWKKKLKSWLISLLTMLSDSSLNSKSNETLLFSNAFGKAT